MELPRTTVERALCRGGADPAPVAVGCCAPTQAELPSPTMRTWPLVGVAMMSDAYEGMYACATCHVK
jgi:hypothetical protein